MVNGQCIKSNICPDCISGLPTIPETPFDTEKCPNCGISGKEILATNKLGCPTCYSHFGEVLKIAISKIQNASCHVGKRPEQSVEYLEIMLKEAIKNEDFEKAAYLRDKIKKMKS